MLKGKIGAALVCCFVIATTAGTWAAYSIAVPAAIPLLLGSAAHGRTNASRPQTSNTDAKGDRLAVATLAVLKPLQNRRPLRQRSRWLPPARQPSKHPNRASSPVPSCANLSPLAAAAPEKPKRAAELQKLLLDDLQISALRTRLNLSPTQEEFWPAVEVTLRNVVRQHARKTRQDNPRGAPQIDVNSPEVQQLISAAVPLIMRLSEEQKREVRQLARIIGLETVASRI